MGPKRIIVEFGDYGCHNLGDISMLQVAIARISELWPQSEINVFTYRPDQLSQFCPTVHHIDAAERRTWLSGRSFTNRLRRAMPSSISATLQNLEELLWLNFPSVSDFGVKLRARLLRKNLPPSASGFRKRITSADLVVVCGMGMINDAFKDLACSLLDELKAVLHAGIPVAAFGQGIGPITDPELLAKARSVLPCLELIALREGLSGVPLLQSLGVSKNKIIVTGDDAVELAYQCRPTSLGNSIGVNLRLASYAQTGDELVSRLREPLVKLADEFNSALLPVPITLTNEDSDVNSIAKLIGALEQDTYGACNSPEDVMRMIGRCRVVVTGSYHGGVFALSQGIPVVGLVQSDYYKQKFTGLQAQFPGGCSILDFRQPITPSQIQSMIRDVWKSAAELREPLLAAAVAQIEASRAAYRSLQDLFQPDSNALLEPAQTKNAMVGEPALDHIH